MSSLKKFDYRIKDNHKQNIFLCGIVLVIITIVGVKLYQSKAEFTGTSSELNLASGKVRLTCTDKVKPGYNQELTNYVDDLYKSDVCPELVDDETEDNNIRYIGASPDNYVWFNDELWRIIGVMNNVKGSSTDTESKGETRIKLIRVDSLGQFKWDYKQNGVGSSMSESGNNDWTDSQLMMMLNPKDIILENWQNTSKSNYIIDDDGTAKDADGHIILKKVGSYFNRTTGYRPAQATTENFIEEKIDFSSNGLTDKSKELIDKLIFSLNKAKYDFNSKEYYDNEKDISLNMNQKTWLGYIGLMYPSDYGFASNNDTNDCWNIGLDYWNSYDYCRNHDWLIALNLNGNNHKWTISPRINSINVFVGSGNVYSGEAKDEKLIYPVVYLKSSVKIISGNGSKENPFRISL